MHRPAGGRQAGRQASGGQTAFFLALALALVHREQRWRAEREDGADLSATASERYIGNARGASHSHIAAATAAAAASRQLARSLCVSAACCVLESAGRRQTEREESERARATQAACGRDYAQAFAPLARSQPARGRSRFLSHCVALSLARAFASSSVCGRRRRRC